MTDNKTRTRLIAASHAAATHAAARTGPAEACSQQLRNHREEEQEERHEVSQLCPS